MSSGQRRLAKAAAKIGAAGPEKSGGRQPGFSRQQPVDQKNYRTDGEPSGFGFSGFGGLFVQIDRPFPAIRFDALDDDVVLAAILHFQILKQNREKVASCEPKRNCFLREGFGVPPVAVAAGEKKARPVFRLGPLPLGQFDA